MVGQREGEKSLRNGLAVSIQYINVRVRQTARQTPRCSIGRVAEITAPPLSCFNSPHGTKNAVFRKKNSYFCFLA